MADKQAKLTAALRKRPSDDDDVPPPPLVPTRRPDEIKLRKSNLNGTTSWEQCLALLELNLLHEYAACVETVTKMLTNITTNPSEPKFRKIRASNPGFAAKVYSMKGAPELFALAGFKDTVEEGFLVLPEDADLALVQRALDALGAQQASRREEEEKKRKLMQTREREAREARLQKASDAAAPAQYDSAVAANASLMVDEEEAMVEAIEVWMDGHPALKAGRALDAYAIERQVPSPGGTVTASVAASAGASYFDYVAHMKRSGGGVWSVLKIEMA
mmetsp:Transcript_527/g.1170  ORF Transcript_527/g.1170 Transcript_527/m.1170 type:complete len:275 (-) Transcript_527:95-919(-)